MLTANIARAFWVAAALGWPSNQVLVEFADVLISVTANFGEKRKMQSSLVVAGNIARSSLIQYGIYKIA